MCVVVSDVSGGRLYCRGTDGCMYCVDLCEHTARESAAAAMLSDGGGDGGSLAYMNEGRWGGETRTHVVGGDAPSQSRS